MLVPRPPSPLAASHLRSWIWLALIIVVTGLLILVTPLGPSLWALVLAAFTGALGANLLHIKTRQSERTARTALDRRQEEMMARAPVFSWEIDVQTAEILAMFGNVEAVLGYAPEELVGRHAETIVNVAAARKVLRSEFSGAQSSEVQAVVTARHRDGHQVSLRELRLPTNRQGVVRGVSVDISELVEANMALRHQAEHDALTGLSNRRVVEKVVSRALAEGKGRSVVLVVVDLDRFKEVNDTLGHPAGDRLLRVIATRLSSCISDAAVVARLGGDEFAFVFIGDLHSMDPLSIGQRIHEAMTQPVMIDGLQLGVACSVGIAISPEHGSTYEDLLQRADIAMYQAKHTGGVEVFTSAPRDLSVRRLRLISEIPGALERGEFELYFQPQVDLVTGVMSGVEGLARWRHPKYGLLLPGAFFDALMVGTDYGHFSNEMLRQAIEFSAETTAAGYSLQVAVNLDARSFLDQQLPETLRSLLDRHAVPAHTITLELVESEVLDEERGVEIFRELERLGLRFSIDDFGTGHSTFSRLRALKLDEVKIDRTFVQGLGQDAEDAIIVRATVDLAHLLGHDVVAEGVETTEQLEWLKRIGCGKAQGFFWSQAVHRSELLEMLDQGVVFDVANSGTDSVEGLHLGVEVTGSLLEEADVVATRRALQELFKQLADTHGPKGVLVKDLAGRVVDGNASFQAIMGEQRFQELVGKRDDDFASGADAGRYEDADFAFSGFDSSDENRVATLQIRGREVQLTTVTMPLYDDVSRPIGAVYILSAT